MNDNAVEAVVNKRQEVAKQLGEYFNAKIHTSSGVIWGIPV